MDDKTELNQKPEKTDAEKLTDALDKLRKEVKRIADALDGMTEIRYGDKYIRVTGVIDTFEQN